jgi:hypothetical protein
MHRNRCKQENQREDTGWQLFQREDTGAAIFVDTIFRRTIV